MVRDKRVKVPKRLHEQIKHLHGNGMSEKNIIKILKLKCKPRMVRYIINEKSYANHQLNNLAIGSKNNKSVSILIRDAFNKGLHVKLLKHLGYGENMLLYRPWVLDKIVKIRYIDAKRMNIDDLIIKKTPTNK